MKSLIVLLVACGFAANIAAAESIPLEKVKEKAKTCSACHSDDGNASSDAQYPRLAGQYHDYLAQALHEYKIGERKNAVMAAYASALSEAEIQALADYYASLPGKVEDLSRHQQGGE